jgi:hypothetical protein
MDERVKDNQLKVREDKKACNVKMMKNEPKTEDDIKRENTEDADFDT